MKPLCISFSGGKTSGYMTHRLLREYEGTRKIVVVFANTGQEQEATLEFVHQCDRQLGFQTIWLEAKVSEIHGEGTTFTHTNFECAARRGEPYEAVIKKYGIPNMKFLHCTRELKQRPITKYLRTLWAKGEGETAIGIRADEANRMPSPAASALFDTIYPLVTWGVDKQEVNDFWESQPFTLNLHEHQGNCKWCFKKSYAKHAQLVIESPEIYEFPRRMEHEYGFSGPGIKEEGGRVFFRGNRSTDQLIQFVKVTGPSQRVTDPDENSGCTESCEPFTEEVQC